MSSSDARSLSLSKRVKKMPGETCTQDDVMAGGDAGDEGEKGDETFDALDAALRRAIP